MLTSISKDELHDMLVEAYIDARKNERSNKKHLLFEIDTEVNMRKLTDDIWSKRWRPSPKICFMIREPSVREVFAPSVSEDETVSHLLFNLLEPIFEPTFIYDSYSCRKGKGTLFGIERFDHHIRSATNNYTRKGYVLNLDISGYFMNIDRLILFNIVKKRCDARKNFIRYDLIMYLTETILSTDPLEGCIRVGDPRQWIDLPPHKSLYTSPPGVGLTIGDVISQLFSNIYLNELDQFCKRKLKCKNYGRYVDDARIISIYLEWLQSIINPIGEFLDMELHLTLHPDKTKIISTDDDLKFLGACLKPHRIYLDNRSIDKFNLWIDEITSYKHDIYSIYRSLNSRLGYFKHFKAYSIIKEIIDSTNLRDYFDFNEDLTCVRIKNLT